MRSIISGRCLWLVLAVYGLPLWVGCGSSEGPSGTVTGRATYNGNPVPSGSTVMFMHQERSLPATGLTAADGSYKLLMRGQDAILPGPYRVCVLPPEQTIDETDAEAYKAAMMGGGPPSFKPPFPEKYRAAETSGLTFTVQEGSNSYDVELKDEA